MTLGAYLPPRRSRIAPVRLLLMENLSPTPHPHPAGRLRRKASDRTLPSLEAPYGSAFRIQPNSSRSSPLLAILNPCVARTPRRPPGPDQQLFSPRNHL